jgi:membrane-bound metal-dependent hydrolase YbcI (DUF457 family)
MFAGHFGMGFGLKRAAPALSLGWLFLAVNFVDIVWSGLVLLGVERVAIDPGNTAVTPLDFFDYPYTHSLVATLAWIALTYAVVRLFGRADPVHRTRYALILALAVGSHFLLDLITHRPDLPLWPGSSDYLGLGLWRSVTLTGILEMTILFVGFGVYLSATKARSKWGRIGPWVLVSLLAVVQLSNYFGPPPPSVTAIGVVGLLGQLLLVALAFSVDRGRTARTRV